MIVANVIWAANWPYWYWLFPAYAAGGFVVEALLYYYYQRRTLPLGRSLISVTLSNFVSYAGGFVLLGIFGELLPGRTFLVPQPAGYPPWSHYSIIPVQFLVAYILTVIIEGYFLRLTRWGKQTERLFSCVVISNLASYTIIFTGYVLCWSNSFERLWRWQQRVDEIFRHKPGG